ncbi:MAG: PAS domain-containing sensor histidine kinase [Ginsengibacter sp.]
MKTVVQPGYFDIKARNSAESAGASPLSHAILDSLPARIAVLNADGIIQTVNEAWVAFENENSLTVLSKTDYNNTNYIELLKRSEGYILEESSEAIVGILAVLKGDISSFAMEYCYDLRGIKCWFLMRITGLPSLQGAIVTHDDITDRKEIELMKDEFISIASHELKTPITSLKGIVHILKLSFGKQMRGEGGKLLSTMESQLNKLVKILSDLLVMNATPGAKVLLHLEKFDFKKLVNETVRNVKNLSPLHFLSIAENESISFTGDRFRMEQVITNLLTNAVKYSPQSNQVIIKSTVDDGKLLFSVQDFGIGIDNENLNKVFERFYRVKTKRTFAGFGLGLYISAEIIKAHRGKIWVESESGKGCVFHFSLPLTND